MSCYSLQQNAFAACEEMRGSFNLADQKEPVICPKPCRVGVLSNMAMRPFRWLHFCQQTEESDSKAGAELLDIIFKKENHGEEYANQVASSPYFCGSPPVRAANPLIQDVQFGNEKNTPISAISLPPGLLSPSLTSRKGGCVRMNFGLKPAAVRIEGFDCLNRDRRQNSSIPAVA